MYSLLALDLDGTVLNSNHEISSPLVEVIQALSKKVHTVIVTGRHHVAAKPYYQQLGLSTPIICCNGTYVYDYKTDSVLSANPIAKPNAETFITLAQDYQLKMVMYVRDAMLYSQHNPVNYMYALEQWSHQFPATDRPNIFKIQDFHEEMTKTEHIWKFVVEGDVDHFLSLPFVRDNFNGERSWHDRVDFASKGNSKGNALKHYIKPLGLNLSECVAVGDNHNDISMLTQAGLGIAMHNASDAVQNVATLVTDGDNDHPTSLAHLLSSVFHHKASV